MNCVQTLDVAAKNDGFRRMGFGVMMTSGARDLPDPDGLMAAVRDYDRFTNDNDPYGEHDFGSLVWQRERVFWKIDYYDQALGHWQDPTSPECQRVLTIMLAEEY
jgi:maltoporin